MDTIEHMTHKWFIRWWATICFFLGIGVVFVAHSAPMKPIDADMEVNIPGLVCPSCAIGIKNYFKKEGMNILTCFQQYILNEYFQE